MKTRITLMVAMMTIAISAAAMPYTEASKKALFLSDKMAYELNLSESQYEAAYEINLDYLLNIDEESDVLGFLWQIRNRDMKEVLADWQYDNYMASEWFCRPFSLRPLPGRTVAHGRAFHVRQLPRWSQPDGRQFLCRLPIRQARVYHVSRSSGITHPAQRPPSLTKGIPHQNLIIHRQQYYFRLFPTSPPLRWAFFMNSLRESIWRAVPETAVSIMPPDNNSRRS